MIPEELLLLAIELVKRLVESGHPDPKGALQVMLDGIQLAAQVEAREKFG